MSNIILFCTAQIFVILLVLSKRKFHNHPNNILRIIVFLAFVISIILFFYFKENSPNYQQGISLLLMLLLFPLIMCIPSLIYTYALAVIHGKVKATKKILLHFIPAVISVLIVLLLIRYRISAEEYKAEIRSMLNLILALAYLLYPLLIYKELARFFHVRFRDFVKIARLKDQRTLLVRIMAAFGLVKALFHSVHASTIFFPISSYKIFVIINLFLLLLFSYIVTYVLITEPKVIHYDKSRIGLHGFRKYEKSSLTREKAISYLDKINTTMESEQLYLNPEFTLNDLSVKVNINAHNISETLNGLTEQSFNDYVNQYRIEAFKTLSAQGDKKHYTILALAHECGFNSKASFYKAFKKFTGLTPSQFLNKLPGN